jgi:hypothetical protein
MCVPLEYNKDTCITAFQPHSKLNRALLFKYVRWQVLGSIGSLRNKSWKREQFRSHGSQIDYTYIEATQNLY